VAGADELAGAEWTTIEKRRDLESIDKFTVILEAYTTTKSSECLYREGQSRAIAIAPVNTMEEVLADPQLKYLAFFRAIYSPNFATDLIVPGKPYRLYDLPNFDSWSLAREAKLVDVEADWSTSSTSLLNAEMRA
jgi:crotonobetainyl-CoA:carnitine CoA-transferase CaiB-like acyl-CoA transferase